jgi:hypothetical protein
VVNYSIFHKLHDGASAAVRFLPVGLESGFPFCLHVPDKPSLQAYVASADCVADWHLINTNLSGQLQHVS